MLDDQSIDIPCNNCGHKTLKQIRWIKQNEQLACHCGSTISLDCKQLAAEIRKYQKQLKNMFL